MPNTWTINGVTIDPPQGTIQYEIDAILSDEQGVYTKGNTGPKGTIIHREKRNPTSSDPTERLTLMGQVITSVNSLIAAIMATSQGQYATITSPFFSGSFRIRSIRPKYVESPYVPMCDVEIEYEDLRAIGAQPGTGDFGLPTWTINGAVLTPKEGPVVYGEEDIGMSVAVIPRGIVGRSYGSTGWRGTVTHKETVSGTDYSSANSGINTIQNSLNSKQAAIMNGATEHFATVVSPSFSINARITRCQQRMHIEKPWTVVGELEVSFEQVSA